MSANYLHMDPFLSPAEAENMLRIAESLGSFGTYAEEGTSEGLGESLPQRFDAGLNYVQAGLFDHWRIPILTCVSWFGAAGGGAFTFYPGGADCARESIAAKHNSAILIDTDRFFHGVERVSQQLPDLPEISPGTHLNYLAGEQWELRRGDERLAEYSWPEIRYSISWKGYCFADEARRRVWEEGSDDLSLDAIVDTLEEELRRRRVLQGARPDPDAFALMMVQTFVQFPRAGEAA